LYQALKHLSILALYSLYRCMVIKKMMQMVHINYNLL
jgi:hypothetical protein